MKVWSCLCQYDKAGSVIVVLVLGGKIILLFDDSGPVWLCDHESVELPLYDKAGMCMFILAGCRYESVSLHETLPK